MPVSRVSSVVLALLISSCASRRASFRVLPAAPHYILRSPDAEMTPFPHVLGDYANLGDGWVDLFPLVELRVENAHYRERTTEPNFENYLGTATVRYRVGAKGMLHQIAIESSLSRQPADQPPVDQVLSSASAAREYHRFFFQVLINKRDEHRRAVLLSATTESALGRLTKKLGGEPRAVCGEESIDCTVFPSTSIAALEIPVVVNGDRRTVTWGSEVRSVATAPRHLEVLRLHAGRRMPVEIDQGDPEALRLPLLPGDHVNWR